MKKILLLLSTSRQSSKSVTTALDVAEREQAELIILFILDQELPQNIIEQLSQEGWIGGKAADDLRQSILNEYLAQGKSKINEIEQQAMERSIPYRSICCQGQLMDTALKVSKRERVDLIIVNQRKRSSLSRFIFGSPAAELKEKAGCEVLIIDEEDQ